jgi:D-3-phosphoglycerate dehydrogenase
LIIGVVISLSRRLGDRNREMHSGTWNKVILSKFAMMMNDLQSAAGCREVRGKTIGIVGYGHIGSQLSVLAEAMGMKVIFYDIVKIMPLGNSQ